MSDAVGAAVAVGLVGPAFLLLGSTGIWVEPGLVTVVDLLVVTDVPAELVDELRWQDGLTLASTDGVAVGTMALGGSLIAAMTGDRRQRNVAVRLSDWLSQQPAKPSATRLATRTRWRWTALAVALLWMCACAGLVLLPAA